LISSRSIIFAEGEHDDDAEGDDHAHQADAAAHPYPLLPSGNVVRIPRGWPFLYRLDIVASHRFAPLASIAWMPRTTLCSRHRPDACAASRNEGIGGSGLI
jgi:hypothetical protein